MSELKPCPFCGGEAKYENSLYVKPLQDENGAYVDYDEMYYWERTYCTECGAEISSESDDEEEETTITKWNTRYLIEYNVEMKDSWIPCSERLPETGTDVIVYYPYWQESPVQIAHLQHDYYLWETSDGEYNLPAKAVTHWMPLPEPPESEAQNEST